MPLNVEHRDPERGLPEELSFRDVVVFYNFVFDLGRHVNPTSAARRLLQTGFALSSPNCVTSEVEVASRFKYLLTLRQDLHEIAGLATDLGGADLQGVAARLVRHPRLAYRILRSMLKTRGAAPEKREPTLGREKWQAFVTSLEETASSIDASVRRMTSWDLLQLHVDQELFSPIYLSEGPHARVNLQPFFATVEREALDTDVGVLIHRTGVGILTFYVSFAQQKAVEDLIRIQVAGNANVSQLRIARPVVEPYARSLGMRSRELDEYPPKRDYSSGVEWLTYDDLEVTSLLDVFQTYRVAVTSALMEKPPRTLDSLLSHLRTSDWMAYPVLFMRSASPEGLGEEMLKRHYPRPLTGLIQRDSGWRHAADRRVKRAMKRDLSPTKAFSLYLEESHATVIYHGEDRTSLPRQSGEDTPGQSRLPSHLRVATMVQSLLTQCWALHILDRQLRSAVHSVPRLDSVIKGLLLSTDELYVQTVSYGSVHDVLRFGRRILGIEELHDSVMLRLDRVQRLVETEDARQRASSEYWMVLGTALLTFLFGLASAGQVVAVLSTIGRLSPAGHVRWLAGIWNGAVTLVERYPVYAVLILYAPGLCFLLWALARTAYWCLLSRMFHRRPVVGFDQSGPARRSSFTWPVRARVGSRSRGKRISDEDT